MFELISFYTRQTIFSFFSAALDFLWHIPILRDFFSSSGTSRIGGGKEEKEKKNFSSPLLLMFQPSLAPGTQHKKRNGSTIPFKFQYGHIYNDAICPSSTVSLVNSPFSCHLTIYLY